jgi:hypothetical protein
MVIGNFKNEAIQKAERIDATHILWRDKVLWSNNSPRSSKVKGLGETAFVDAYKCPVIEGNKEKNREKY